VRSTKSRAKVDALQEIYTNFSGLVRRISRRKAVSKPVRGGSTTRASAIQPSACHFGKSSSAVPISYLALVMWLISALMLASSTASGMISIPRTSPTLSAKLSPIVPTPA